MFNIHRKDIVLHPADVSLVSIPIIELAFVHPLFLCEMVDDSRILTPMLLPNLEKLITLTFTHKITNTYLISPGYMNNSERWSMQRLIQIAKAEYFYEGFSGLVYRFELEDGNSIDYDINGFNQNRNELTFVSILNLAK